ncbi:MAG: Crp/Fnr family transcriptional regulator [Ginsengibacter sp.]
MIHNSTGLISVFPSFSPQLLGEVSKHGSIKSLKEGDELLRSGQNIRSTILIIEGLVKIYREDEEGNEIYMYHLGQGQACALSIICSLQNKTSEIKAKAVASTQVLAIPIKYVDQWVKEHYSWYQFVLSTYRGRFEELLTTIDDIAFRKMDERVLMHLKKHKQMLGSNIIPLTHAQIASELSTSREVISRLLKKLEEKGFIKLNRQNIEIINLDQFSM